MAGIDHVRSCIGSMRYEDCISFWAGRTVICDMYSIEKETASVRRETLPRQIKNVDQIKFKATDAARHSVLMEFGAAAGDLEKFVNKRGPCAIYNCHF